MPNIIGEFSPVYSSVDPLEAHVGHLKHLTNDKIAKELLRKVHKMTAAEARETSKLFSSHIGQALNFHHESKKAISSIRPVLQYYTYLNLAVSLILAYRPTNYNRYRRHGVEDKTHSLSKLELSSQVLKINQGAVPLFHSIISDVPLRNKTFRFGQLISGFYMCGHELEARFNKTMQSYWVSDEVKHIGNTWHSVFEYHETIDEKIKKASRKRIEDAMPLLKTDYNYNHAVADKLSYISKTNWGAKAAAESVHKSNGLKLINYGGHSISNHMHIPITNYAWRGTTRASLLPTLTSTLLLSFSLASIVRYRPMLLESSMNSPILLITDTFIAEADSIFIPSLRNLLFKEEVAIGLADFV